METGGEIEVSECNFSDKHQEEAGEKNSAVIVPSIKISSEDCRELLQTGIGFLH